MNELKTIFVEGKEFDVLGTKINIKTICVGDLPIVLNITEKVFSAINKMKNEKDKNAVIIKTIKEDFLEIIKLLEVTTNLSKEDIPKLNLAALSIIVAEVIKENSDFLSLSVIPNLEQVFLNFQSQKSKTTSGLTKSKN